MFEKELDLMCETIRNAAKEFLETVVVTTCLSDESPPEPKPESKPDRFPVGSYVKTPSSVPGVAQIVSKDEWGKRRSGLEYVSGYCHYRYSDGRYLRSCFTSPWKPAVGDEVWVDVDHPFFSGKGTVRKILPSGGVLLENGFGIPLCRIHPIEFVPKET